MKRFLIILQLAYASLGLGQSVPLSQSLNNIPTASTFTTADSVIAVQGGVGKKVSSALFSTIYAPITSPTFLGTVTVPNDSFALGTKTTGNYVGSVATTSPIIGGSAGSEGAALTLSLNMGATFDFTGVVAMNNNSLKIDDIDGSHQLQISPGSNLTADRILTLVTGDIDRTITLNGNTTLSGTNTGDQTITLTGDVTGSGTGSFAATIANDAVTFAKFQNITDARLLGRSAGSSGDMQEITVGSGLSLAAGALTATATAPTWGSITGTLSSQTDLQTALNAKQPLDGDLTALAALGGTNTIYYRSAADTWTAVTIGANLTFTGGTLAASGGGGGGSATGFFTSGQIERARGGTGADTSAYGVGIFGSDGSNNTIDIDTTLEVATAMGMAPSAALQTAAGGAQSVFWSNTQTTAFASESKAASSTTSGAFASFYENDGAAMASGDRLGGILIGGSSSGSTLRNSAMMVAYASQNWVDGTANGSRLVYEVAPNGGINRTERMAIEGNGLISFGGSTSSFPAIKRTGTAINFRLADDSGDADITAGTITGTSTAGDSATAFFTTGQIERARGGTNADTSAYGNGLLGSDSGNATIDVDTITEFNTALGITGTPSGTTFLRGDGTWAVPPGGGGAAWGAITGTLSSQTDLQAALDLKAPLASPTFTGNPLAPTPSANDNDTSIATTAYVQTEFSDYLTDTVTLQNKDLTNVNNVLPKEIQIACSDLTTAITAGTTKAYFRAPRAMTIVGVRASALTAPTGSTIIIDINETGSGTIMTTDKLSIDATENTSTTAATPATVTDTAIADDAEVTIDFDQVGSTVAGAGIIVTILYNY